MKLITVPLNIAREAVVETTKETMKTTECLTEFGKIGSEIEAEHINFGKLDDGENQLTFFSDAEDFFCNEYVESKMDIESEIHTELDNDLTTNDISRNDVSLEPQVAFRGGLSACSYKCIQSYCYPVNIARGIGTKTPYSPNSKAGHT